MDTGEMLVQPGRMLALEGREVELPLHTDRHEAPASLSHLAFPIQPSPLPVTSLMEWATVSKPSKFAEAGIHLFSQSMWYVHF